MRSNEISALKTVKCSTPGRRVGNWALPSGGGLCGGAGAGLLLLLQSHPEIKPQGAGSTHLPSLQDSLGTIFSCRNKLHIFIETKDWFGRAGFGIEDTV